MGLTVSLDMGSEKMVMALASVDNHVRRLIGIKIMASQGMERGVVKDRDKVMACVRGLMAELVKDREVEVMNVALSGDALRMSERRVTVPLQKKVVEQSDLLRAEQKCRDNFEGGEEELVDLMPVAYSIDRGELMADPLGKPGRNLEVTFQVYTGRYDRLRQLQQLFEDCGVEEVVFYPVVRAYSEGLGVGQSDKDFALVDLGARELHVVLFREGLLEYETSLPLGMRTIDTDIMAAFALTAAQARKLKHEYGQALRSACKNKKLQIPDTRLTLESRDLATVVQSRAEELLEGVVFQLQNWGFDNADDPVWLTGGGSRLLDIDVLLHRMSGHIVSRAIAVGIQTSREEILRTPEYLVALGLLLCSPQESPQAKTKWWQTLKDIFNK